MIYKCPKCGEETLQVTEDENKIGGFCTNCNYKFMKDKKVNNFDIIKFINDYAFIIGISAIIISLFIFATLSGQDSVLSDSIKDLRETLTEDIDDLDDKFSNVKGDIVNNKAIIDNLKDRLAIAENNITALNDLYNITENIYSILNDTNSTIQDIYDILGESFDYYNTTINFNLTNYQNQTDNNTYYAHLELEINSNISINDFEMFIHYPKVNLTNNRNATTGSSDFLYILEPFINLSYLDTVKISGYGSNDHFYHILNITWNKTDYNTTILNENKFFYKVKINDLNYAKDEINFEVKTI